MTLLFVIECKTIKSFLRPFWISFTVRIVNQQRWLRDFTTFSETLAHFPAKNSDRPEIFLGYDPDPIATPNTKVWWWKNSEEIRSLLGTHTFLSSLSYLRMMSIDELQPFTILY